MNIKDTDIKLQVLNDEGNYIDLNCIESSDIDLEYKKPSTTEFAEPLITFTANIKYAVYGIDKLRMSLLSLKHKTFIINSRTSKGKNSNTVRRLFKGWLKNKFGC